MEQKQISKKTVNRRYTILSRLAALVLAAALALGLSGCEAPAQGGSGSAPSMIEGTFTEVSEEIIGDDQTPEAANFEMHFIDVGQALSVLVCCDGKYMLYDGGNVGDNRLVVSYILNHGIEELEYVFDSHSDEDHVGGLAGVLASIPANHVYAPVKTAESKCFKDFVKYTEQQGLQVEIPTVGQTWQLGSARIELLGPIKQYKDPNDTSLVLRIDYQDTSFLLTGDMERNAEKDLVESGANLKADVLQAGHHGSETSSSYLLLQAVMPEFVFISCGENNKYGHPHEAALSRLRDAGADVYRTDLMGSITVSSNGRDYFVLSEYDAEPEEQNPTMTDGSGQNAQPPEEIILIGNKKTKKYHLETCPNLPGENNQVLFASYEAAVEAGYVPCGTCIKPAA